jgi:hypothetical protein
MGRFEDLAPLAKWLRKERELSFYGDTDFIPTEEYTKEGVSGQPKARRNGLRLASDWSDLEYWRRHPLLRFGSLCLVARKTP